MDRSGTIGHLTGEAVMKSLSRHAVGAAVMVWALVLVSWFSGIAVAQSAHLPQPIPGGFDLPNGWRITPAGKPIADTEDMVLKMTVAPDGRAVIASHGG